MTEQEKFYESMNAIIAGIGIGTLLFICIVVGVVIYEINF